VRGRGHKHKGRIQGKASYGGRASERGKKEITKGAGEEVKRGSQVKWENIETSASLLEKRTTVPESSSGSRDRRRVPQATPDERPKMGSGKWPAIGKKNRFEGGSYGGRSGGELCRRTLVVRVRQQGAGGAKTEVSRRGGVLSSTREGRLGPPRTSDLQARWKQTIRVRSSWQVLETSAQYSRDVTP